MRAIIHFHLTFEHHISTYKKDEPINNTDTQPLDSSVTKFKMGNVLKFIGSPHLESTLHRCLKVLVQFHQKQRGLSRIGFSCLPTPGILNLNMAYLNAYIHPPKQIIHGTKDEKRICGNDTKICFLEQVLLIDLYVVLA